MKKNFYVTGNRKSIKLRCVTPLYVEFFIQQQNHKEDDDTKSVIEELISECLSGSKN